MADFIIGDAIVGEDAMGTAEQESPPVQQPFGLPNNYRFVSAGNGMSTSEKIR